MLALNTTMRACEIKALRWYDVDFLAGTVTIRRSKTEAGQRMIPLNQDALSAMRELYGQGFGARGHAPGSLLCSPRVRMAASIPRLPRRAGVRPGGACGRPQGLAALRFHDLRHHAITELAESQASDATIMAIAGHVSRQMLEHYSHVRLDLKRKALDGLSTREEQFGGQTNRLRHKRRHNAASCAKAATS